MANSRKPGPIGVRGDIADIADGTLARQISPRPGAIGNDRGVVRAGPPSRRSARSRLPQLNRGKRGPEVVRLQKLLNARIVPTPGLGVDGIFGPLTYAATRLFQRGRTIGIDGIVGPITWAHLLGGHKVTMPRNPVKALPLPDTLPELVPIPKSHPRPKVVAARITVWEWPLERKFVAVIERVPVRLPEALANEFRALINPTTLATMLALIVLFSLLSGGTALVVGLIALGFDVAMTLAAALQITVYAANERELDDAADELAHIVFVIGVAAFAAGVAKAVGKIRASPKMKGPLPTEPSTPIAVKPQPPRPAPKPAAEPAPKAVEPARPASPKAPPPANSILARMKSLTREALGREIRRVTGDPEIVLWEQVGYGDIYTPVQAGPQAARQLGVQPGEVIGYKTDGKPTGASAIFGLENAIPQNIAPYLDPFLP